WAGRMGGPSDRKGKNPGTEHFLGKNPGTEHFLSCYQLKSRANVVSITPRDARSRWLESALCR
ncbi:MAG: hypothetical protein MI861_01810, partial [Pirellulales bacterium]|nr:hypothetical protein [Pirellulales bacterium]